MALPADPAAFVAAAEHGINARDLEGTAGVYSPDARLTSITDGALEVHFGQQAIKTAWTGYLAAMQDRGFRLDKRLLSAADDTIVNTWTGTLGGRTDARGIEYWRFDAQGKVREHEMYSYLNTKPSTSPIQRLRLALAYPLTALSFLRESRRAGG